MTQGPALLTLSEPRGIDAPLPPATETAVRRTTLEDDSQDTYDSFMDTVTTTGDDGTPSPESGDEGGKKGCGCTTVPGLGGAGLALLPLLALVRRRR